MAVEMPIGRRDKAGRLAPRCAIKDDGKPPRTAGEGNGLGPLRVCSSGVASVWQWDGEKDSATLIKATKVVAAVGGLGGGKIRGALSIGPRCAWRKCRGPKAHKQIAAVHGLVSVKRVEPGRNTQGGSQLRHRQRTDVLDAELKNFDANPGLRV